MSLFNRRTIVLAVLAVVIPVALAYAATFYQVNNGATINITEHSVCRTVTNSHASGQAIFVPTATSTEWAAFYNNPPAGVTSPVCGCTVTPGSQTFSTAGAHTFTVPCHNNLTVQVWGGGGGGVGTSNTSDDANGTAGTVSRWNTTALVANGGAAGNGNTGGAGGTASGGTTNTTGQAGNNVTGAGASMTGAKGGNAPSGGAGGAQRTTDGVGNVGTAPGAGGGGARTSWYAALAQAYNGGAGGGSGGYSTRVYSAGTYAVGSSIPVTVGNRGTGGVYANALGIVSGKAGGNGAVGRVTITWN